MRQASLVPAECLSARTRGFPLCPGAPGSAWHRGGPCELPRAVREWMGSGAQGSSQQGAQVSPQRFPGSPLLVTHALPQPIMFPVLPSPPQRLKPEK